MLKMLNTLEGVIFGPTQYQLEAGPPLPWCGFLRSTEERSEGTGGGGSIAVQVQLR